MKRLTALVLALLMMALALTACTSEQAPAATEAPAETSGAATEDPAATDSAAGTTVDGETLAADQTLRVSIGVDLTDLSPLTDSTTEGSEMLMTVLDTLVRQGENGTIEEGSGLAESWDVSEDGKTYTFHLRDAVFSNGDPIRAQDFEYTWKKVLAPETASEYAYMLYTIEGAEAYNIGEGSVDDVAIHAVDDKTLEVTLVNPIDYFISTLVIPEFSVIPEGYVEECGDAFFTDVEHMVFSGPFVITEWTPTQRIVVEKNPNYWDAENVKLDTIIFEMATETNTIVNMYNTDQIDVMKVQADFLDTYRNEPGFISVTEPVTEYVKFNCKNEFFANANIRKAFSMALDRVTYMNDVMRTGSTPAYGFVPPSVKGSNGQDFRTNNGDLYTDIGNGATVEEANALLDQGLAEIGKTREDLNQGLSLVIGEGDDNLKTAQVFQQYWKNNLGVDVEIKSLQYALRQAEYQGGMYTIGKEGWGADYNDAMSFLELFITDSPYNDVYYSNPEYDALLAEANTLTGDERLAKMEEAEKILIQEDGVIAPTFFQTRSWVAKSDVRGIIRNGCGLRVDYKYAYIVEE